MSADIVEQVIHEIKSSKPQIFSIQLDETTDVSSCAQLIVYVRYVYMGNFKEEFLFCKQLETTTTAQDVFNIIDKFFRNYHISWLNVCGVCTDGAPSMLGCKSGFQQLVKCVTPSVIGTHCMLHRQVLATKTLPHDLLITMKSIIDLVNFVKSSALNTRLFSCLCGDMNSPNSVLLFHTTVRWLSRGKVLNRVFELRNELKVFIRQKNRLDFEKLFTDKFETLKTVYLVDMFTILNTLNLSLQGPMATCLDLLETMKAFSLKLQLWIEKLDQNKFHMFEKLSCFIQENDFDEEMTKPIGVLIKEHLQLLKIEISRYFPELPQTPFSLVRNPFSMKIEEVPKEAQENFIELITSDVAKTNYSLLSINEFWVKSFDTYPVLSELALRMLLPFPTTYLCEATFSSLLVIKNKYRNNLVTENDLRCAVSKTEPRIFELVKKKQAHSSH